MTKNFFAPNDDNFCPICQVQKMTVTFHSTAEDRESHRWLPGRNKTLSFS